MFSVLGRRSKKILRSKGKNKGCEGTWSDGKLVTKIGRNNDSMTAVMKILVHFGAPENMLVDGKPHLGTDRKGIGCRSQSSDATNKLHADNKNRRYDAVVLAVGLRIEHPMELIKNPAMYNNFVHTAGGQNLVTGCLWRNLKNKAVGRLKVLIPARRLNGQSNT
ncbi:hypothetical protein C5167_008372 [Papaver somniferum]|uniref:FAD/NAD(P)-binding domain-containing protein n=1 Tax=Papaver somniferum TaxID=3469 RepID=A0A4Y7JX95_PAPSO|nr:hypothetical protein C5167_008372 [Papaver somniferum]